MFWHSLPPFAYPDSAVRQHWRALRWARHLAAQSRAGCRPGRGPGGPDGLGGRDRFGGLFRGRKLSSADLQLLILSLLAEKPAHGYELIRALEERSGGAYAPSPGMVYPALTYLEEIGHAEVEADGKRKLYQITADGRSFVEGRREDVAVLFARLAQLKQRMETFRSAVSGDDGGETAGDDADPGGATFMDLRQSLRQALRDARQAGPDEQARVAAILAEAIEKIRRGGRA